VVYNCKRPEGKLSLDEVKNALDNGKELHTRYKAEPQGLILEHINYPQIVENITNEPVLLF
jgi:tRNA U38,U39,U40 pseudouridine synthase TruA